MKNQLKIEIEIEIGDFRWEIDRTARSLAEPVIVDRNKMIYYPIVACPYFMCRSVKLWVDYLPLAKWTRVQIQSQVTIVKQT